LSPTHLCVLHHCMPHCLSADIPLPCTRNNIRRSAKLLFFRVSKRAGENNREIWGLTVWEELETILKAGAYIDHAAEQVSNKCIAVRKVATPLRELTCHMGSHSVTCHPAGTRLKRPRRTHVECSQLNTYKWCIQNKEVTETTSTSSARRLLRGRSRSADSGHATTARRNELHCMAGIMCWFWRPNDVERRHCMHAATTTRYDTRCYFNVRSKADMNRLNLPHGDDN